MGDSMLNFTEVLRRIGVKNRTGVDLAETVRMSITTGDLSHLVPPIAVPVAGAEADVTAGVAAFAQFTLHCRSAGGLFPLTAVLFEGAQEARVWITDANPFGALTDVVHQNFSFGQTALSQFSFATVPAASVAPAGAPSVRGATFSQFTSVPFFVGPGQFLNLEFTTSAVLRTLALYWQEIPAAQRDA